MKKKVALLPGDGIGPEVCREAVKVLDKIADKYGHEFIFEEKKVGGAAIDEFGEPLPNDTLETCQNSDAILFGSVGGPKWDNLAPEKRPEVGSLLPLRKKFDLFVNLRPARLFPNLESTSPLKDKIIEGGFDFVVLRELTGGIYFGKKGKEEGRAFDEMKYERHEVERITRVAFEAAKKRKGKVTNVDKSNVLLTSVFWREVVNEVHQAEYSDVELEHLYIDNATMQILVRPKDFDVILTSNMFGDILSDEAAQISGSLGNLPSASLNESNFGLFEPAGGSAPDIAGKDMANPIAQILSASMMLKYSFSMDKESEDIDQAIKKSLESGFRTGDIFSGKEGEKKVGTQEMGKIILENI